MAQLSDSWPAMLREVKRAAEAAAGTIPNKEYGALCDAYSKLVNTGFRPDLIAPEIMQVLFHGRRSRAR